MIDQMTNGLAVLRQIKRRLTITLCVEVGVVVIMFVATAITIDIERPWWSIALFFIVTAIWQLIAARTLIKLVTVRRDEVKLLGILGSLGDTVNALRAFGLDDDLLRRFSSPAPTDENPAPVPTSEETKP
jgi:hypothetical protein